MTTCSMITGGLSDGGSTYRQIAAIWSTVLSLPPVLAAMTPRRRHREPQGGHANLADHDQRGNPPGQLAKHGQGDERRR